MQLKAAVVQMKVAFGKPEVNLQRAERFLDQMAEEKVQLALFPEIWPTGLQWDLATEGNAHVETVCSLAKRYRVWINGSYLLPHPQGKAINTSLLIDDQGAIVAKYEKIHLFPLGKEDLHVMPGNRLCLANSPWGKIGLAVCYDVRFPEMFTAYAASGARLVLLPAAFPHPRLEHWKVLTRARAIENQLFFLTSNYVGTSHHRPEGPTEYFGHASIIDPWGEILAQGNGTDEAALIHILDLDRVDEVRRIIDTGRDRKPHLYGTLQGGG